MRRWSIKLSMISVGLLAGLALGGCDTDSYAPPAPGRSRTSSASSGSMPVRAKEIAMIFPAGDNTELSLYDVIGATRRVSRRLSSARSNRMRTRLLRSKPS